MSASSKIAWHSTRVARHKRLPNRLAGDTCRYVPSISDANVSKHIALRDNPYRQAQHASILYWFCSHRLTVKHHRQALHQYLCSTGFSAPKTSKNNPFTFRVYIYIYIYIYILPLLNHASMHSILTYE